MVGWWGVPKSYRDLSVLGFLFSFFILCYQTAKLLTPGGQYNQDEIVKCMLKIFIGGGEGGVAVKDG